MQQKGNPGREPILDRVTEWLERDRGLSIAARLGFENAYALAMTEAKAEALGIETIADLVAVAPQLRMGGDYEFFGRPEWSALEATYGLRYARLVTMDSTLMYEAAAQGEVDVISAYSTDGRIPAFELRVLEDTRGALPPYDAVLLIRNDAAAPLRQALATLDGAIDGDAMRAANRHVDLDGGTIEEAAARLLRQVTASQ
jgi:osmoprotectant transport system permease protein